MEIIYIIYFEVRRYLTYKSVWPAVEAGYEDEGCGSAQSDRPSGRVSAETFRHIDAVIIFLKFQSNLEAKEKLIQLSYYFM